MDFNAREEVLILGYPYKRYRRAASSSCFILFYETFLRNASYCRSFFLTLLLNR